MVGNESRLGQVFLNLIVNAAQAIPEGNAEANSIELRTREVDGQVVAEIADSGGGIPAEIMGRIFTPFFTTKPVGQGTGLGLSICHRIVNEFGGDITIDSTVGKGTCVPRMKRRCDPFDTFHSPGPGCSPTTRTSSKPAAGSSSVASPCPQNASPQRSPTA